jgi:hypothetical protein
MAAQRVVLGLQGLVSGDALLHEDHEQEPNESAPVTDSTEDADISEITKTLKEAKKSGGGFVLDLRRGKSEDTGYLVEVMPEKRALLDHDVTPRDIQLFYNENRALFQQHPELRVGGYKNELNVSAHTDDQETATALAKKLDQRSVWDVKAGQEIPTGGQGRVTHFSAYPFADRIKDLRRE